MNQRQQHNRTSSQGRRALPPHGRTAKAPPLRRGHSHNNAIAHSNPHGSHLHLRPTSKKVGGEESSLSSDDEESGMASFLQFCVTCERQIVTPGTNILYCSEACRRKDVSRATSLESFQSLDRLKSSLGNSNSFVDELSADIIPQMLPTRRPWSMSDSELFLSSFHYESDHSLGSSDWQCAESSHYYGEFFSGASYDESHHQLNHSYANTDTTIPSLIHSPSSSWGTVASYASHQPQIAPPSSLATDAPAKAMDMPSPYPAGPASPTKISQDSSLKSCASTMTSFHVAEAGDISYGHRSTSRRESEEHLSNSFKQLSAAHSALRASPRGGC